MLAIKNKLQEIENRLREKPQGFDLDDYYMCIICSKIVGHGKGWYDKLGPKCMLCQKAVIENVVPAEVCLNRRSWLAMWEVCQLGYHQRVIRMLMRKKKLKARVIKDESGQIYFYVFIKDENKSLMDENLT